MTLPANGSHVRTLVDLDYKALSNAGTWFVGKLQTERDKARLLEGLESVAVEQGTLTDRAYLEKVIASLASRVFLLHDIHRPARLAVHDPSRLPVARRAGALARPHGIHPGRRGWWHAV